MIGLFCFDGPLYKDKNGVYCNVTLTDEMFKRYFCVVDRLYIIVRTYSVDKTYMEMNMKPLTIENVEVIEVDNLNTIKGFLRKRKKFEKEAEKYIAQADLIFARMPSNVSNSVLKIALRHNKKYLVEVGGCAWDSYWNHGLLGKLVAPLMYYNEKKYVGMSAYSTYVTKQFLQKRYPSFGSSISCSNVYLKPMDETVLKRRIEKIQKMNLKKLILGQAVNSIDVKYKGMHLIIRTLKKLNRLGITAEFQIVGPGTGEYLKKVAEQCGVLPQVKFIGTLTKDEMFEWYQNIDIYVQPSKQEGLPRSVIEAMSVGCPAVGSAIAGIPELLEDDNMFVSYRTKHIFQTIYSNINSKERFLMQANRNFKVAKNYNIDELNERRTLFFLKYANDMQTK